MDDCAPADAELIAEDLALTDRHSTTVSSQQLAGESAIRSSSSTLTSGA